MVRKTLGCKICGNPKTRLGMYRRPIPYCSLKCQVIGTWKVQLAFGFFTALIAIFLASTNSEIEAIFCLITAPLFIIPSIWGYFEVRRAKKIRIRSESNEINRIDQNY